MAKRMIVMLSLVVLIIAGLGFVKFKQIQTAIAQGAAFQPPPEAITTIIAGEQAWPETLAAIGTAASVQGVVVSADLPGTVDRILFESGRTVEAGAVLVELDTRQERAQLAAVEAQLELASLNFDRVKGLLAERVVSKAEFDRASAEQKAAEARVGEIRAAIARKTVKSPFAGILGLRQVNVGQYLSGGDPIVTVQALHPIYVNFGVPQQAVSQMKPGREVRVTAEELPGAVFPGTITALDSVVNEATRNVTVQATLQNPAGTLRPGMFVQTEVLVSLGRPIITLPASAVHYAPFGDSVFVVSTMKTPDGKEYRGVRQQFVKLGGTRGDQVAVLSGLKAGEEVATSGVFKLRTGAAIHVDNTLQPGNNPKPTPENR